MELIEVVRNRRAVRDYTDGPRFSRQIGVTPILEAEQMRALHLDVAKITGQNLLQAPRTVKLCRK